MFCKNCGNEVKDGAKFCGKCGGEIKSSNNGGSDTASVQLAAHDVQENTAQAPKKNEEKNNQTTKRSLKSLLAVIALAAIIIFLIVKLVSCAVGSTYDMGESGELDGLEITVTSFTTSVSIASGDYVAKDGMTFAVAGVKVYNNDDEGHSFMDSMRSYSKLVYDDKEFSMETFYFPPGDLLSDEYLEPMQSKEGYIVYEIPESIAANKDDVQIKFIRDNGEMDDFEWEEDIDYITFNVE